MAATLAEVLRRNASAYLASHTLSTPQAKAWRAIAACRTPALGGQRLACNHCGHEHWHYHSCRNRHCPQCGARAKDRWLQGRLAEVLQVPYGHLVFTLPHALNGLYHSDPRWLIDTLFASVAATLHEFAANPRWMGAADGQAAFSLVLHTWTQDLRLHLHLHAVMACGVLTQEGRWQSPARKPDFLFPVRALSRVYRGKFIAALRALAEQSAQHRAWLEPAARQAIYRHDWVVYAKTPMAGPAQVLDYLSRYTHRTAIGNERIKSITSEEDVVFTMRSDFEGGKRLAKLPGEEFVRRFLLHVLPGGIKRIRHYGVLANGCKKTQLRQARQALGQPAPNPPALEAARAFLQRVSTLDFLCCAQCKFGRMQVVQTLPGNRRLPAPQQSTGAPPLRAAPVHARGPP